MLACFAIDSGAECPPAIRIIGHNASVQRIILTVLQLHSGVDSLKYNHRIGTGMLYLIHFRPFISNIEGIRAWKQLFADFTAGYISKGFPAVRIVGGFAPA
ncbi:hypothetical protein D3C73_1112610 [compost metagenome]